MSINGDIVNKSEDGRRITIAMRKLRRVWVVMQHGRLHTPLHSRSEVNVGALDSYLFPVHADVRAAHNNARCDNINIESEKQIQLHS